VPHLSVTEEMPHDLLAADFSGHGNLQCACGAF
jgi:hypothetical protein